ncbi:MAG: hypothetical protein M3Q29_08635 [Chloroflexota bacterium]|nr:hypothetical protein [Chloroflexota bacterium]
MRMSNSTPSNAARWAAYAAILLHLLLAVPIFTLGLVAPDWAIVLFYAMWAALLALAVLLLRTRPWLVLAIPIAMLIILVAALWLGDVLLGWTA